MDLGTSVVIKGELSASEDLTLCGHLEGSVRLPEHTLTIGANAEVKAEIVAKTVIVLGSVTGNVTATERLDVRATGSVIGDVASPRLVIADGGHAARQGADDRRVVRIARLEPPQGRSGRLAPRAPGHIWYRVAGARVSPGCRCHIRRIRCA